MDALPYYETERAISEYLLFHYGAADEILPWPFGPATALNYPARCVSEMLDAQKVPPGARGLDLGCAVGRATFELSRSCNEVIGIDFSGAFVRTAQQLQQHGSIPYAFIEEGDLTRPAVAEVPSELHRSKVKFQVGDAQALPENLGRFDVVLMANLADRLRDPACCLRNLKQIVNPGGQLIITTPCTWLQEYTPKTHWLGGYTLAGHPVRTLDTLHELLDPHFDLTLTRDLPFLIREHARKYQWSVALGSRWVRREPGI